MVDNYNEKLAKWFNDEFLPMLEEERSKAVRIESENEVFYEYWQGQIRAFDNVRNFIDKGIELIRCGVYEESNNGQV